MRGANNSTGNPTVSRLGEREREVLEVLWHSGSATVHDVAARLSAPLAYTTVMTILDRLYKKRLVLREKRDRAFVYSAGISASALEQGRTSDWVRQLFSTSIAGRDVLLSCFVDAVQQYDEGLLSSLEEKIRQARRQESFRAPLEEGRH